MSTNPMNINADALLAALSDPTPSTDYARGVRDLLHLLGLLPGGGIPPSEDVKAMMLGSLRAHLKDGVTVGINWQSLEGDGLRGVDILKAMETARLAAIDDPTPARVVRVVQAVIKARVGADEVYLMQWDGPAGRYQPIGGKQEPTDEGTEGALRRELYEELALDAMPGQDACTLSLLRADWRTMTASATYGVLTAYAMDFYAVTEISFPVRVDADTRWLSFEEIAGQRAEDGRPVTPVYHEGLGLDALAAAPVGLRLDSI